MLQVLVSSMGPLTKNWHVLDDAVGDCIPERGLIRDYMDYASSATDAPQWYHLGSFLTTFCTALGYRELRVQREDRRYHHEPLRLWSVVVGASGDRKNGGINPAMRVLRHAHGVGVLPARGSIEGWHDQLADPQCGGIALLHRNEFSGLLTSSQPNYLRDLGDWLLDSYEGGPFDRRIRSADYISVPRVRLSLLAGIPPDIFSAKTNPNDWASGFLPRICLWASARTHYKRVPAEDSDVEREFGNRIRRIGGCGSWMDAETPPPGPIIMPKEKTEILSDWVEAEVERKRYEFPEKLFSAMARLQEKGYTLAALYAAAEATDSASIVTVLDKHVEMTIEVLHRLKATLEGLYREVSPNAELREENSILEIIRHNPGITTRELQELVQVSRPTLYRHLNIFINTNEIEYLEISKDKYRPFRGSRAFYDPNTISPQQLKRLINDANSNDQLPT